MVISNSQKVSLSQVSSVARKIAVFFVLLCLLFVVGSNLSGWYALVRVNDVTLECERDGQKCIKRLHVARSNYEVILQENAKEVQVFPGDNILLLFKCRVGCLPVGYKVFNAKSPAMGEVR